MFNLTTKGRHLVCHFKDTNSSVRRAGTLLAIVLTAGSVSVSQAIALGKPEPVQLLKYLNPIPRKHPGNLNKGQDRVIKKQSFKNIAKVDSQLVLNSELGYFAIVPLEKVHDSTLMAELLDKPEVNGLSATLPWSLLEPEEDKFDWASVDQLLKICQEHSKTLILRVSTCGADNSKDSDTPAWVFAAGAKSLPYKTSDGKEHHMPIFWDSNYLGAWGNFIGELASRYDKNQSIHSIGITGGGMLGSTTIVPAFALAQPAQATGSLASNSGESQNNTSDSKGSTSKDSDSATTATKDESAKASDTPSNDTNGAATTTADSQAAASAGSNTAKTANAPSSDSQIAEAKSNTKALTQLLTKEHGMSQHQLVEHWKYVADMFLRSFKTARMNFNIDPTTNDRPGQDSLDEISDYLVYRYGERVYLTRQNVDTAKHGFDQYRLLLKFHGDTLTGYQLTPTLGATELEKLVKNAAEDGISFCEVPIELITSKDEEIAKPLSAMLGHMGYQVVYNSATLPKDLKSGEPLKASFNFVNLGAACPMRPERQLDKDLASSYKVQLELRNSNGKPIVLSLHTPEIPTQNWKAGAPVVYEKELKMPPNLKPGQYSVYLSLVDAETKRKLRILDSTSTDQPKPESTILLGSIEVIQ